MYLNSVCEVLLPAQCLTSFEKLWIKPTDIGNRSRSVRIHNAYVAQLEEHFLGMEKVNGSIPFKSSTREISEQRKKQDKTSGQVSEFRDRTLIWTSFDLSINAFVAQWRQHRFCKSEFKNIGGSSPSKGSLRLHTANINRLSSSVGRAQ